MPRSTAWPPSSLRPAPGCDARACLYAAITESERILGLDDLREDHGSIALADETTDASADRFEMPVHHWIQ
jgi:hypothetical protein